MTMMDSDEHRVMRVVFTAPKKAKDILLKLNMPHNGLSACSEVVGANA